MCFFVTIGTTKPQLEIEALLGEEPVLWLRPSADLGIRALFPAEEQVYEVLNGQCSCALVIQGERSSLEDERRKRLEKLKKKGWSKAKIARAISDWEEAHGRQLQSRAEPGEQFLAILRALASLDKLHVFVYSSDRPEGPAVRKRSTISSSSLTSAALIEEDTLITVAAE